MANRQLFTNNAISTLAAGISGAATAFSVAPGDGAKFPSPGSGEYFLVTLVQVSTGNYEIVKVTARSGDNFTSVQRAQEGTTALSFAAGDKVELRLTAGTLTRVIEIEINPDHQIQVLTDAPTIQWDMNRGAMAQVTLAGNRTVAAPANIHRGVYTLFVKQDATGGRSLTWSPVFKWALGIPPALTPTPGAVDIISFVSDGVYLYGSMMPDVK